MKTSLQFCFLFCSLLSYSQTERAIINKIDSLNSIALDHYRDDDIAQSFNLFNQAIELSDSIGDTYGNSEANFTLGKIYDFMNEPKKAKESFLKVISISEKMGDNYLMASSNLYIGKILMDIEPPIAAIPYFNEALKYAQKDIVRDQFNNDRKEQLLFETNLSLSQLYLDIDNTRQAHIFLSRAEVSLGNIIDQGYYAAKWKSVQGKYFVAKELYSTAVIKFEEATKLLEHRNSIDIKDKNALLTQIYKELSTTYILLEKDSEAYSALLMHNKFKDEFFNEEKNTQNLIMQSKFLIENYKNAARVANNDRLRQVEASNKILNINYIISIILILLFVSLITTYKSYSSKSKLSKILKAKNEQLELAKDSAEKSSKLKSNFISNVTHELRTPLYGVVGLTSLLLKNNDLSEKDSKFLKSLKYSGDYLLNLVNDILQIGKIESQKIELKNVSVNIRVLLENLVNSFDYRLEETNNQIQITVDKNIPEFI
ncbi:ATP-binding protein [Psychroserpens damuponensis]|uniref:ATP-binding protein n=1 Tax=Psychroserpens damuponensis TaxID=943936 RepID=UPI0005906AE3|nr:tetratricopeptide repeat protein [Psychroserpens damuponensis]